MATMSTTITASGSFSLTDSNGVIIFTYSPSFTTTSNTSGAVISTGEILTNGTSDTTINLARHNKDRIFTFIKNVDTDYSVAVKPDGDSSANLDIAATTAAQKVQFLLCDGLDN